MSKKELRPSHSIERDRKPKSKGRLKKKETETQKYTGEKINTIERTNELDKKKKEKKRRKKT